MVFRVRRRRRHIGSAGAGTVYYWLNEDKRNAVEMVVEEKAAEREPERAAGTPPASSASTNVRP
jgi:hypothetical protein